MINLESKVMPTVAEIINFVKEQASTDLKTYKNSGELSDSITENDIERICLIIENSISSNFMRSSGQLTSMLGTLQAKIEKNAKTTTSKSKK